jgi:putative phage-type endonuclease
MMIIGVRHELRRPKLATKAEATNTNERQMMNAPLQTMTAEPDRRKYLGGSDVAAVLGISPWKTPLDLYLDKITPAKEQPDRNKARIFSRGKTLEPYVLDILAAEESLKIVNRGQRYIDPTCDFLAAEIDAEYYDEKLQSVQNIEIKTSYWGKGFGDEGGDDIPVYYTAQAMHGLMVTNRQVCVFGVLVGLDDFRVYRIERDDETIEGIRRQEFDFWQRVIDLNPPEPSNTDDVLRMFKQDSGAAIEVGGDVLKAYNELVYAKQMFKDYGEQVSQSEEIIKLHMREAATLTLDGKPILTWKSQETNRFDQTAFKEAHPELFEQFKKVSTSRVFRIK